MRTLALAGVIVLAFGVLTLRRDQPGGFGWLWTVLAGPADQGPADFATLSRRPGGNDALVCTANLCAARPDLPGPEYNAPPEVVRSALRDVILSSPDATQVAADDANRHDRYVARTRILRFPDTVDVLVVPNGENRSTVALYSRSLLGRSDFGVNLDRVKGWLADPRLASLEGRG